MGMSEESIMASIEDLVAMAPRATGTSGGESAAAYVSERFAGAGLETQAMEVPSFSWRADACSIRVGDEDLACSPILHSGLAAHDWTGTAEHRIDAAFLHALWHHFGDEPFERGNLDAARLNLLFGREVVAADKDFDPLSYEAMFVIDERVARQSFPESFEDVFEV